MHNTHVITMASPPTSHHHSTTTGCAASTITAWAIAFYDIATASTPAATPTIVHHMTTRQTIKPEYRSTTNRE
jgi:hypothetical protein